MPVTGTLPEISPDFRTLLERHADRLDLEQIDRALRFSSSAHRGQKRVSGEDFIQHSIAVARTLVEQQLDTTSIVSALLHDVVEDSDIRAEDISREFGAEVANIVDGLTKISSLTFRSSAEQQVENYRKLLLSIAKDARVIIIKLADRLHNMRTLDPLSPEKRARIATETREIYAPLAHRFGMAGIKAELEDLAFKYLETDDYESLVQQVASRRAEREQMIQRLKVPLDHELKQAGLTWFDITGRPKHLWSIYQKMRRRNKPFDEIYDLMAIRVIVKSVQECYHVLGVIHHNWTPLQERIKDYIASPKSNAYQSLHTTVFGPGGHLFEVQIRTQDMHRTAEYGIAAHWLYKSDKKGDRIDEHFGWFRQLLELQQDAHTPEEFLEFLKVDLYQDEIFVFTPKGDVKQLPKGATPIDFAFIVHTDVGLRCQGAKVNGRIAPLHRELKNGDTVEVLTGPAPRPSRDWLAHVRTARARHKIKGWIRHQEDEEAQGIGHELLLREVKRRRLRTRRSRDHAAGSAVPRPGRRGAAGGGARAGGRDHRPGDPVAVPGPPLRRRPGDPAQRDRPGHRPDPAGQRHPDPGALRAAGALRPVLPAGAGGRRGRIRDPGAGNFDSPGGLPQPADPVGRRSPGGDRLAGGQGGGLRGALGRQRRRSSRPLRRRDAGHQPERDQRQGRRTCHQGRHGLQHDRRGGGQPHPPGQGHQDHPQGEGHHRRRAAGRAGAAIGHARRSVATSLPGRAV